MHRPLATSSFLPSWRVALFVVSCLTPAFCRGELQWETQKVGLTAKPGDKEAVGVFRFANAGNVPVTITSIQPDCGCTTAELARRTYAPGEAGEVRAVFTIGDRMGVQEKTIHVTTDGVADKPVSLVLRVAIAERFTLTPGMLLWRLGDEPGEKSAVISATGTNRITAVEAGAVASGDAIARIEPVEAGTAFRVLVRPASTARIMTAGVSCIVRFADGPTQSFVVHALVR